MTSRTPRRREAGERLVQPAPEISAAWARSGPVHLELSVAADRSRGQRQFIGHRPRRAADPPAARSAAASAWLSTLTQRASAAACCTDTSTVPSRASARDTTARRSATLISARSHSAPRSGRPTRRPNDSDPTAQPMRLLAHDAEKLTALLGVHIRIVHDGLDCRLMLRGRSASLGQIAQQVVTPAAAVHRSVRSSSSSTKPVIAAAQCPRRAPLHLQQLLAAHGGGHVRGGGGIVLDAVQGVREQCGLDR